MMFLERIESLYQLFKREILLEQNSDQQLLKIQELIHFCWMNYPLRFSDVELENIIEKNIINWKEVKPYSNQNTILHIASTVFEVGGHTRWLMNCIDHLPEYNHTVVLTRQSKNIPQNVLDFIDKKKVNVIRIPFELTLMQKVKKVKEIIIESKPFKVFSFHHPDDLISILATTGADQFQSVLFNHADHTYSLGARFFDIQVDFRRTGSVISNLGKSVSHFSLQVLPLAKELREKENTKFQEQYDAYDFVVGTLTNVSKVQSFMNAPTILDVIFQLAEEYKNSLYLIIGLDTKQTEKLSKKKIPENVHCLGIITDPNQYYSAMDFFLEPFPMGSGMGIIEACQYGAIPIFGKHPVKLCSTFEVFHEKVQSMFNPDLVHLSQNDQLKFYLQKSDSDRQQFKSDLKNAIQSHHRGANFTASLNLLEKFEIKKQAFENQDWLKQEASFFHSFQMKTNQDLLTYLLGLKHLVTRKILVKIITTYKFKLSIKALNAANRGRFIHRLIFG
jgi:hypothetical protein